ncbi:hypothetical protein THAOC_30922 [Thalassiosira oceanica]|uniref:Uncharacterized protein n=1 Tax=Thalassiosira oceanica TaxID=159749 RepID=K0RD19_THAOC|nr:hypothetical protein THAOC_30922 [Thalassiosira oceanica]|eukprot:EJK50139.1 hypothetical protein THAOC_30922 [Thalassiosira oceanica]
MTRTSNSSPDGTRVTREETEEGDELVSSTGGGICPAEVDGGDGPKGDTAEISAFLGRREQGDSVAADQDLAEKAKAQRINSQTSSAAISPASTSSASADVCLVDDVEGPMDVARISATLELQDLAEKAEAQRINSHTSSAAIPPPRSATSVSPSRRESSASSAQRSLAETNMAVSTPDQESTIPPADGDGLYGRASAQRALRMEIAGCESVPSSIMAEAYTVPDSPVFTASIVEVIPWYKQKRYVCILMMVMILIIGIAAVAGVLLVDGKQPPDEVEMVEITSIIYVNVTDGPTETPTGQPTTIPSSEPSYLPTYSPTVHVCAAPIGQPNSVTPSANLCGTTVMQPTNLETSHLCNCTDSPAVIVNGTGVEFNLNSFAIACIAGSQPAIVVVGESNSVLGRQTKQTSWERTGARGGICGSPVTHIKILLQGSGNHTVRDLILVLSEDSSLDQVGVEMESSGNTVDNCDIGSPFTPNPMLDSDPGNQVGVEMRGDNNVLSNNYISVRRDLADNYGTKTIGVRSSGNDCLIIGNTFSEGHGGIVLKQGSCQVIDNHISAQQDIWAIEVKYGIIFLSNSGLLGPESVIENNTIRDSSESCIYLQSPYGFIIKRNTMERCQNPAILLVRSPTNVTIESNTLVDSKWGIVASDATSLAASNNTIYNSSTGIQFQGSTSRSSIIGNSIQKCNNSAIYLRDSHHVTVKDNTLVDSKWGIDGINATYLAVRNMKLDGIQLKNSTLSSISGNFINNCGDPAISLYDPSNITVEKNTLFESPYGILSHDATSLIVSNITDDGMHFRRSSSSSVSDNTIKNLGGDAIVLFDSSNATVEHNILVDSKRGIEGVNATAVAISQGQRIG